MIRLTDRAIDLNEVLDHARSPRAGAVVLFLGTTRRWTDGKETKWLDYECYAEMAEQSLTQLVSEARQRWPSLLGTCVVHRLGRVEVGEASIAIAVSSPHREDAFEAGKWLIDAIKRTVPVWKREHGEDGTDRWVHPGCDP